MEEIRSYFKFEKITHCGVGMDWRREMRVGEDTPRIKERDEDSFRFDSDVVSERSALSSMYLTTQTQYHCLTCLFHQMILLLLTSHGHLRPHQNSPFLSQ